MPETNRTENMANTTKEESKESHFRSVIKGITWRIIGTIDTMVISWFITGNVKMAAAIGGTEVFTKILLYYLHERLWIKIPKRATEGLFKVFNRQKK